MGIFAKPVAVSAPDLNQFPLPDGNYIHRHLSDIASLLEAMEYRVAKPEIQAAGGRLGTAMMAGFPDADGLVPEVARQSLIVAATRGFALASLYGSPRR